MKVESAGIMAGMTTPKESQAAEAVDRNRAKSQDAQAAADSGAGIQPEELLDKIKALTENGLYGVRFEYNDRADKLIIRLIDAESGEQIRQIPPEELVDASITLKQLSGNLIDRSS